MGKEREKERYLCMVCKDTLYCVDLASSRVMFWVNLREAQGKLPFGMRSIEFPIDSGNVYLIGGEYVPPSSSDPHTYSRSSSLSEFSFDIFKVIPPPPDYYQADPLLPASSDAIECHGGGVTLKKIKDFHLHLPPLNAGKGNPVIEFINGKYYALHKVYPCSFRQVPTPAFEVLDQDECGFGFKWKRLSDPPFYTQLEDGQEAVIMYTVVFANRWLYVAAHLSCPYDPCASACYDTKTRKWSTGNNIILEMYGYSTRYLPQPLYTTMDNNYYVAVSFFPEQQPPTAVLVNSKGTVVTEQTLPDLFDPTVSSLYLGPLIIPLDGNNRMCAIQSTGARINSTRLRVTIFSLSPFQHDDGLLRTIDRMSKDRQKERELSIFHSNPQPQEKIDFLSLNIERQYTLEIPGSLNDRFLHMAEHAFFI